MPLSAGKFVKAFRWAEKDILWAAVPYKGETLLTAVLPGLATKRGLVGPVCVSLSLGEAAFLRNPVLLSDDFPSLFENESTNKEGVKVSFEEVPDYLKSSLPTGGKLPERVFVKALDEMITVFLPETNRASAKKLLQTLFKQKESMKHG